MSNLRSFPDPGEHARVMVEACNDDLHVAMWCALTNAEVNDDKERNYWLRVAEALVAKGNA